MNREKILEFEKKIGYQFADPEILVTALTHSSYSNEKRLKKYECNERLEFLGDAVLEMVSSEFLYKHMKKMSEGEMSKLRASLVCEPTLALDAKEIELPEFIYLGKGEEATGGRTRASIVSDALEALIGAIFLDGGIEAAKDFIYRVVLNDIDKKRMFHDSKTILQERIDAVKSGTLSYKIIKESGPDHNKTFEAVAMLNEQVIGQGIGQNKKTAEQQAAYQALKQLEK